MCLFVSCDHIDPISSLSEKSMRDGAIGEWTPNGLCVSTGRGKYGQRGSSFVWMPAVEIGLACVDLKTTDGNEWSGRYYPYEPLRLSSLGCKRVLEGKVVFS